MKGSQTVTYNSVISNFKFEEKPGITKKKISKTCKIIIIASIALIIILTVILIIVFIIKKDKKKKVPIHSESEHNENEDENLNLDIKSNNKIIAKYYIEEGKNITLINPSLMGINKDDYSIEILEVEEEGKLRNLKSISNLIINQAKEGILTVNITLEDSLKSISGMFKNCENLIDVDFTNFNTSKLEIMNSLFEGCNNLESVVFFNSKIDKISEIENLFKGCQNLIQIENFDKMNL